MIEAGPLTPRDAFASERKLRACKTRSRCVRIPCHGQREIPRLYRGMIECALGV